MSSDLSLSIADAATRMHHAQNLERIATAALAKAISTDNIEAAEEISNNMYKLPDAYEDLGTTYDFYA